MSLRSTQLRRSAATAVVLSLGTGLCAVVAPAAVAAPDPAAEVTLPAGARFMPRAEQVFQAGATGYLHEREGTTGTQWTDYASGESRPVADDPTAGHSGLRAGLVTDPDGTEHFTVTDIGSGAVTRIRARADFGPSGAYNADSVVVIRKAADGVLAEAKILRRVDGQVTDQWVEGLPYDATTVTVGQQDSRGALITVDGLLHYFAYETARLTELPIQPGPQKPVLLGGDHILAVDGTVVGGPPFTSVPRANPTQTPLITAMPVGLKGPGLSYTTVGDSIVAFQRPTMTTVPAAPLKVFPIGGWSAVSDLLPYADERFALAPDGSLLVVGGKDAKDWAVRRISLGARGQLVTSVVRVVPPVPAKINALALGAGKLAYVSLADGHPDPSLYQHHVAITGKLAIGQRTLLSPWTSGALPLSLGNGRTAHVSGKEVRSPLSPTALDFVPLPATGTLIGATGRYTIVNGSDGKQYIGDYGVNNGSLALTRTRTAAAVWGTTLWVPGKTTGSVAWQDLKTKKTSPDLATGAGCVPNELQAVGRWIHWSCDTVKRAGVWDQKTRTSTSVGYGESLLGDGFVVRRNLHDLQLTDVSAGGGAPAPVNRIATVPLTATRGVGWTVDKFGGHIAYTDAEQRVHIQAVTVPRSAVGAIESRTDTNANIGLPASQDNTWDSTWQLSRPVVAWKVAFKDAAGRTVRTLSTNERQGAAITARWDGKDGAGKKVNTGAYSWTLTVDDGRGVFATAASGTLRLTGGGTPFRDYDADGTPEVFTRTGTRLTAHEPLTGAVTTSTGWTGVNHVVPMGDMTGDSCNDVVVRDAKGELYRYSAVCKGIPTPKSPKTRIGAGFNAFHPPLSAGDLTGDGRADLLARMRTTNDLYLYADNGTGGLKAGVKLPGSWKGLVLIGAGDLTGDGHGDLLARDAGGELWRYNGTGKGGFTAKALVFKDWGAGRNAFVGAGDLNGDRKNDLVSRDAAGKLLRNLGDGKGSFGATGTVATGWQGYNDLF
ncbi:FG-GAP-like repeat-containing protein [Streptomyces sp. NPDC020965]|uniref:FG-GAP-like repeat-containing protein n=1 Tax=Streptomyces sp. NPDC020965 TaxID=3365105 RepID=UPI0037B6859D